MITLTVMENIIFIMQQLFVVIKMLILIVDDGHYMLYTKDEMIYIIVFGITVFYNSRWYFT